MSKNLLQDMVKEKRERRGVETFAPTPIRKREVKIIETDEPDAGRGKSKSMLWVVAGVSLVFLFFALSYFFSKVTVTINPKFQEVVLNKSLSATKDTSTDTVPFEIVVISGEENEDVPAMEEEEVKKSARGLVVIYNAFSSANQKLDINTRLEGSNGKMYKTEKTVVVPGMKGTTPGSVEVNVYGSDPGPSFNSAPLDFKIFGFKGTPKYSKFYARSNVNDPLTKGKISGGLVGKFPVIPETQRVALLDSMQKTLQTKLFKKANDQIPAGFIMFKNAAILNIDDGVIDVASAKDKNVPLSLKGTLYGLLFDEKKLTKKIAEGSISGYDGSDVYIQNIKDLEFTLTSKDSTSFSDVRNIGFNLAGSTKIVWKFDTEKLTADLLGKSKNDFNQILLQYPNIDSAQSVINPFWKRSFPDKFKNIHIIVNYPK